MGEVGRRWAERLTGHPLATKGREGTPSPGPPPTGHLRPTWGSEAFGHLLPHSLHQPKGGLRTGPKAGPPPAPTDRLAKGATLHWPPTGQKSHWPPTGHTLRGAPATWPKGATPLTGHPLPLAHHTGRGATPHRLPTNPTFYPLGYFVGKAKTALCQSVMSRLTHKSHIWPKPFLPLFFLSLSPLPPPFFFFLPI